MLRALLYVVLLLLVTRAVSRLWSGIVVGLTGQHPSALRSPRPGVRMVRDPMCGTFVVPDRGMALAVGREQIYFCSAGCRDQYRRRTP